MSDNRPRWTKEVLTYLCDGILDSPSWPNNGSGDELLDEIEATVRGILCNKYGHEIEQDHCGIPSHAYCIWCNRGVIDINHMAHAKVCDCLDDAAECCVESCPCPRYEHSRG